MTAEVLVMNKQGVALAADSAATIRGRKVYNSANKLFRLSKRSSIGVLVYANSELNGVPWEILIKNFRSSHQDPWSTVNDCAESFLEFLTTNTIASKERENFFVSSIIQEICSRITDRYLVVAGRRNWPNERKQLLLSNAVDDEISEISHSISKEMSDLGNLVAAKYRQTINAFVKDWFAQNALDVIDVPEDDINKITELCIKGLYTINKYTPTTGIVITGYGDDEFFPSYVEYRIYGIICGKLLYDEVKRQRISLQENAVIAPFAQRDVIDTFITGIGPNFEPELHMALERVRQAVDGLIENVPGMQTSTLKTILTPIFKQTLNHYHQSIIDELNMTMGVQKNINIQDIIMALSSLSIPDLAQMAKNLVEITSFKRMVSSDIGTVGGPIDVAVISKGDGFIWIDRKHYFTRDRNEHYFDNYKEK